MNAHASHPQSALVGRRSELRSLAAAARASMGGKPQIILVEGPAGVGVSRLLGEAAADAADRGFQVHRGRCYEHIDVPYFPLLDTAFPVLADSVHNDAQLARHRDAIERVLGRVGLADEANTHHALLPQLTSALLDFAVRQPIAIVIDDLQWADQATLDLLLHLVSRVESESSVRDLPLLVMAGTKSSDESNRRLLERLKREPLSTTLAVAGLNVSECAVLLRSEGFGEASTRLAEPIHALTGGNPLWISMVCRQLREESRPLADADLLTTDAIDRIAPPPDLQTGIEERFSGLGADCRRLLAAVATAGSVASIDLLARLPDMDRTTVEQLCREAEDAGVIAIDRGRIEFEHPLYRRAARADLSPTRRRELHAWAASTLVATHAEGDDELLPAIAHHLFHAEDEAASEELLRYAARAAEWSAASGAWAQAARLYDQAVTAATRLDESAEPAQLADLYYGAGYASSRSGADETAVSRLADAAERYRDLGDIEGQARAALISHRMFLRSPRYTAQRRAVELPALIEAVEPHNPTLALELTSVMAEGYLLDAQVDEARRWAQVVGAEAGRLNAADAATKAHSVLGFLHTAELDLEAATRHLTAAADPTEELSDPWLAANSLYSLSLCHLLRGELDDALDRTDQLIRLCERVGDDGPMDLALLVRMARAMILGDASAAETNEDGALLFESRTGRGMIVPLLHPTVAARRARAGDQLGAMESLERWAAADGAERLALDTVKAWVHAELGEVGSAQEILATLPPFSEAEHAMITRPALAAAMLETSWRLDTAHQSESALHVVREARARGQRFSSNMALFLPHIEGLGAALCGDRQLAIETLTGARELAIEEGYEAALARVDLDLAQLLISEGDGESVRVESLLEEAAEIADRADLETLTRRLSAAGALRRAPQFAGAQTRFVFLADVSASTRMGRELGDFEYLRRARRLESILLAAVGTHGGEVQDGISLGDGILAVFSTAEDAIHAGLTAVEQSASSGLQIRVGIHFGEVIHDKKRLYGTAVNTAARFCDAAAAGTVVVSDTVRRCVTPESRIELQHRGEHEMKGLAGPLEVFEVVAGPPGGSN